MPVSGATESERKWANQFICKLTLFSSCLAPWPIQGLTNVVERKSSMIVDARIDHDIAIFQERLRQRHHAGDYDNDLREM